MKKLNIVLALAMAMALSSCKGNDNPKETEIPDITESSPNDIVKPSNSKTIAKDARIGYQIFVDTYANGFKDNDMGNYTGDLKGIIKNLDFLKDNLHADVLWLTPIHPATTYTGYDVMDYEAIREEYGNMDDYKELLNEAHKRDMFVMLDLVINHTSSAHKWFKESSNKNSADFKKYRNYYRWDRINHWGNGKAESNPGNGFFLNGSYYYALFWEQMPDLNFDNPDVYNEMLNVCDYWLDIGVDGFRVDGAKHVYNYGDYGTPEIYKENTDLTKLNFEKNLEFFNKFSTDIKKRDEDCFLTLEVLDPNADTVSKYYGEGVDSCFDFATRGNIISNINSGNGEAISFAYKNLLNNLESKNPNALNALILSNHDMNRAINDLGFDTNKAKSAAAVQMLLPGMSWIYQGDELGMSGSLDQGKEQADLGYRQRYKWGNDFECGIIDMGVNTNDFDSHNKALKSQVEQAKDSSSMFSFYKDMTKLKGSDDVFRYGDFTPVNLNRNLTSFTRSFNGKTYLVAINVTGHQTTVNYNITNPNEIYKYNAKFENNQLKIDGYGVLVIELDRLEGPDLDSVVVHYKGADDSKLVYNNNEISANGTDDKGNKLFTIDVKGLKLYNIEFLVGKDNMQKHSYTLKDDGNKVCHIYIDGEIKSNEFVIDIDSSWGFDPNTQKLAIWAWPDGGDPLNRFIEARVENNKMYFSLDSKYNRVIIVVFKKNDPCDWGKKVKQTVDLTVENNKIITNITWK